MVFFDVGYELFFFFLLTFGWLIFGDFYRVACNWNSRFRWSGSNLPWRGWIIGSLFSFWYWRLKPNLNNACQDRQEFNHWAVTQLEWPCSFVCLFVVIEYSLGLLAAMVLAPFLKDILFSWSCGCYYRVLF